MKPLLSMAGLCLIAASLAACGSDEEKTTVYHDRPVVVEQPTPAGMNPSDVENQCAHGYDNSTHQCY